MIESWSRAKPGKERNGDAHCAVLEQDDRTGDFIRIFAAIADGVGSRPADWKASSTACDAFRSELESSTGATTETRLTAAVDAAHWAVRDLPGGFAGGMTTMCAFALEFATGALSFVNVGDSRLFHRSPIGITSLGIDDVALEHSTNPAMRREVLTRALGQPTQLQIEAMSPRVRPGDELYLATDGAYCLHRFEQALARVAQFADFAEGVAALGRRWPESERHDDSTLVGLRYPDPATSDDASFQLGSGLELPYREIAIILTQLLEAISKRDSARVDGLLGALTERQLVPSAKHIETVLECAENSRIDGARRILERLSRLRQMQG